MAFVKKIKGTVPGVNVGMWVNQALPGSPLVIFLHGAGEIGDGTDVKLDDMWTRVPTALNNTNIQQQFTIVAPQCPPWIGWWDPALVNTVFDWAIASLGVDTNRVYITGLSLGGGGVWGYICQSEARARSVAAAVPICGIEGYSTTTLCNIIAANLPVKAYHAEDDPQVSPWATKNAVSRIANCPGAYPNAIDATYYPVGGHGIWNRVYDPVVSPDASGKTIWQWLLTKTRAISLMQSITPVQVSPLSLNATEQVDPVSTTVTPTTTIPTTTQTTTTQLVQSTTIAPTTTIQPPVVLTPRTIVKVTVLYSDGTTDIITK